MALATRTVVRTDRLDVANNEFQSKMTDIQKKYLSNEDFGSIGVEEFMSARTVLNYLVNAWIEQMEKSVDPELRNFLTSGARSQASLIINKMNEIENHLLNFTNVAEYGNIKKKFESITNALHFLNSEMAMANEHGTNNMSGGASDQLTKFDKAADEFLEWFEAAKSQKNADLIKMFEFDPYRLRIQEFADIPNVTRGSTDVEKTISSHIEDFRSTFRKKEGQLEMKDILEYPMKVHETWKNHVETMKKGISDQQDEQMAVNNKNLEKCKKIEGLVEDWINLFEDKINEVIRKKKSLEDKSGSMSVENTEIWNKFVENVTLKDAKLASYLYGERNGSWLTKLASIMRFFRLNEFITLVETRRSDVLKELKQNLKELKSSLATDGDR